MSDAKTVLVTEAKVLLSCGLELTLREPALPEFRDGEELLGEDPAAWLPKGEEGKAMSPSKVLERFGIVLWLLSRNSSRGAEHGSLAKDEVVERIRPSDVVRHAQVVASFLLSCLAGTPTVSSPGSSAPDSSTASS